MAQPSSTQLQYYRHDYAKVCMTGLLGCRWHRYKQSTNGSRKRDVAYFVFCLLVSLYVIFWFYYWLIATNEKQSINEFMFRETQSRFDWFLLALVIFSVLFSYVVLLLLLSLCHIIQGHQLYTHPVHLAIMLVLLLACIAVTIVVEEMWEEEWSVIAISLQVFGPFLHLGAVGFMTLLSWVISSKWFKIIKIEHKLASMCAFCVFMLALYICPLFINSPCVILEKNLPQKPKIFAHRGASMIAPENTVIAFELAAQNGAFGVETDVQISMDGELFLMHDSTLHRTTNIEKVYPDLVDQHFSYFNTTELEELSAGDWFLKADPSGNVGSLSDAEKSVYKNQKIPSFLSVLQLCMRHNLAIMFDVYKPPESHPYFNDTFPTVSDLVSMAEINESTVFYPTSSFDNFLPPADWRRLYSEKGASLEFLRHNNFSGVHVAHYNMDTEAWSSYRRNNFTTSVYMVNKAWLYSFYWCIGTEYITTDFCDVMSKVDNPVWQMSPRSYLVLWVVADCTSAVLILVMFLVHRYRFYNHRYHPERMSLSSHSNGSSTWGPKRSRRSMKEKLLMRDVQADVFECDPDDDFGIDSNGYNATVNADEGRELSQAFQRNSFHSNTGEDYESQKGHRSNRSSYHSTNNGYQGDENDKNRSSFHGNEIKRSSFISSIENGELFGDSCRKNSYQATGALNEAEHTDIFPNGAGDHPNLNGVTNTYQSETAFT